MALKKKTELKEEPTTGILFIRTIPAELKAQFKAWCARNDVAMNRKIQELMEKTLKRE